MILCDSTHPCDMRDHTTCGEMAVRKEYMSIQEVSMVQAQKQSNALPYPRGVGVRQMLCRLGVLPLGHHRPSRQGLPIPRYYLGVTARPWWELSYVDECVYTIIYLGRCHDVSLGRSPPESDCESTFPKLPAIHRPPAVVLPYQVTTPGRGCLGHQTRTALPIKTP
jgi:hypothetical protein